MADLKDQVWKAFGQLIQRQIHLRQSLHVPSLGTFTYTTSVPPSPLFLSAAGPASMHSQVLSLAEVAAVAGLAVEVARSALETCIAEVRELGNAGAQTRKRLPGVGEFYVRNGVLVLGYDRGSSRQSGRELPPRTSLGTSRSTERLLPRVKAARVDFLLHNQAKLQLACRGLDKEQNGLLPFAKLVEAVSLLENPTIQADTVRELVAMTGTEYEGVVDYNRFVAEIGKYKSSRADTPASLSSPRSDFTGNYDFQAVIPFVRKIWEKKLVVLEFYRRENLRPRIRATASDILAKLKKAGMCVNIHQLKAVLREAQLNPLSVSLLDLLEYCRQVLGDYASDLSSINEVMSEDGESRPFTPAHPDDFLVKIRHFFMSFPIEEVIEKARDELGMISSERFMSALTEVGGGRVKAVEAQIAFHKATGGLNEVQEEEFRAIFCPQQSKEETETRAFRILREWLRRDKLTSEQAFNHLLASAGASEVLTRDQFLSAVSVFRLNSYDSELLFQALDTKHDGTIDLGEWCNKVYEEFGPYQALRDVILSNSISTEDLLIKMNAGGRQRLTDEQLAEVLQGMDSTLSAAKAVEIATAATHRHGYVDVQDFLRALSQEVPVYQGDWKSHIYKRIQGKINTDPQLLRDLFEKADVEHRGKLGLADFQECIYRANVGLEPIEIERLARVLDRANSREIDYIKFLTHLKGPNLPKPDPLRLITERLVIFLNQNAMTIPHLLKRLGGRATYEVFADFLASKVHKSQSKADLLAIAEKMDLNHDGFIDSEDLTSVLGNKSRLSMTESRTYPVQRLSVGKAQEIMQNVSKSFAQKRYNYAEAFHYLDKDGTGMLTAREWSDGLDKFLVLSAPIKDGLFAAMDYKGIGLVDYPTFLKAVKDGEFTVSVNRDNWSNEEHVLKRIRAWIKQQGLTVEAAFRAFDQDFDGVISKADLKDSLGSLLKVTEQELPSHKLDRLYKLLDTYKRNSVQLPDFKAVFEEAASPEWRSCAKQQLGLFLSKEFPDLSAGFESISQLSGKVNFDQFQAWVFGKNALAGFNLTKDLLQRLFADMDSQRKGYLTLQDWKLAFAAFHWQEQHWKEFLDAVRTNFASARAAFDYFLSFQNACNPQGLSRESFQQAVHKLIPKRFSPEEVAEVWQQLTPSSLLTFASFSAAVSSLKFLSDFSQTSTSWASLRTVTAPSSLTRSVGRFPGLLGEESPMKKFVSLLHASSLNLQELFTANDPGKSGLLTVAEFRQAVRQLALGLTSRDIDRLVKEMDTQKDGLINWHEVLRRCQASEAEVRIKQVSQQRLARLRTNMFEYLLSPTDAFKQFDESRAGHLTFPQFAALVKRTCELSGDEEPAFAVVKDLFELIDIRKDGFLDLKEWAIAFKGARAVNWEDTQHFEDVCSAIARNRKVLQTAFEARSPAGLVTLQQARQVLTLALRDFRLSEDQWLRLLKVAEKSHNVDYKLLLEVFKERSLAKSMHPKPRHLGSSR